MQLNVRRPNCADMSRIGVISDTHGLLRTEAVAALRDCDFIIHAGDIGDASILTALAAIAPVTAVRGNNDKGAWANAVPESDVLRVGSVDIYVLHDLAELDLDPADAGFQVVVSGHSHVPRIEARASVLYVNPGSAGPRRFKLPVTVAELRIDGSGTTARLIDLGADSSSASNRGRRATSPTGKES